MLRGRFSFLMDEGEPTPPRMLAEFDPEGMMNLNSASDTEVPQDSGESATDSEESATDCEEPQWAAETETTDGGSAGHFEPQEAGEKGGVDTPQTTGELAVVDTAEPQTKGITVAADTKEPQMIAEPATADSMDAQEMNTAAARRLYACLLAQMSFEVS